jgi:hypothetical protein
VTIRIKLDALERDAKVSKSETQVVSRVQDQMASHLRVAADKGITVPDVSPDIRETDFYTKSSKSLEFVEEVASRADFGAMLHAVKNEEGSLSFHTQVTDSQLLSSVGIEAVEALVASTVALAQIFSWETDARLLEEIKSEVDRASSELAAAQV